MEDKVTPYMFVIAMTKCSVLKYDSRIWKLQNEMHFFFIVKFNHASPFRDATQVQIKRGNKFSVRKNIWLQWNEGYKTQVSNYFSWQATSVIDLHVPSKETKLMMYTQLMSNM